MDATSIKCCEASLTERTGGQTGEAKYRSELTTITASRYGARASRITASRYRARASRPSARKRSLRGFLITAQPPLLCEKGNALSQFFRHKNAVWIFDVV
jgi:hypothetical protein